MNTPRYPPAAPEYPYKLIHETVIWLGGTPKEDAVLQAWRVEYRRTPKGWRHFVLLLESTPTPTQILDACRLHKKKWP